MLRWTPLAVGLVAAAIGGLSGAAPASAALPYKVDAATQANITFKGSAQSDEAGGSVDSLGDVNGDGRPDIIVGANHADNNSRSDSGSAYVIFGQPTQTDVDLNNLGSAGYRIDGAAANDQIGFDASAAGDMNNDGKMDIVVASVNATIGGRANSGAVWIVYGKATTSNVDLATLGTGGYRITGAASGDRLGYASTTINDVNGDGRRDVFVTSADATVAGRSGAGAGWVVFAPATTTNVDLASLGSGGYAIYGPTANGGLGSAAQVVGDQNGDGKQDLVVSAQGADFNGRTDSGSAWILYSKSTTSAVDLAAMGTASSEGFRIDGAAAGDQAGWIVSDAGDVNGDGRGDFTVTSNAADDNGRSDSGSVAVLFGSATPGYVDLATLGSKGYKIDGAAAGDQLGTAAANLGDVNGDGLSDLVVGAGFSAYSGRTESGTIYVVYGRAATAFPVDLSALGTQGYVIGDTAGAHLGEGFLSTRPGDFNGDGLNDVLIGAHLKSNSGRNFSGSAYVIYSDKDPPTSTLSYTPTQNAAQQYFDAAAGKYFYNPGATTRFTLTETPSDIGSGVAAVDFPALTTTGFTGAASQPTSAPYTSAAYSIASSNAAAPPATSIVVSDGQGNRLTHPLSFVRDVAGPTQTVTGAPAGYARNGQTFSSSASDPGGSGVASVSYRYAPGLFGTWASGTGIGTAQTSAPYSVTWSSQPADGQYTVIARAIDNVGNVTDTNYPLTVDNTNPTGSASVTPLSATGRQSYDAGTSTLFYNPTSGGGFTSGTFQMTASVTETNMDKVTFPTVATTGFTGASLADSSSPYASNTYTFTSANTTSPGALSATVADRAGNTTSTSVGLVRDTTGPAPFSVAAGSGPIQNGQALTAAPADAGAGIAAVAYRSCSGSSCAWASGTAIGSAQTTPPYSVAWSSQPADGTATIVARATDKVGNVTDSTKTVTIDNGAPTPQAFTLSPLTGSTHQYLSQPSSTLFYNPLGGGSFELLAPAIDIGGVASVAFPAFSQLGFSGSPSSATTSPWKSSSAYTFDSSNLTPPAPLSISYSDTLGHSTTKSLSFVRDIDGPTGGSVSYPATVASGVPVAVTLDAGNDADAGVANGGTLQRQNAPLTGTTCGAYGGWAGVSASDSTTSEGNCYRYRYTVSDRVGNPTTYTGASELKRPKTSAQDGASTGETAAGGAVARPPQAKPTVSPPVKSGVAVVRPGSALALKFLTRTISVTRKGVAPVRVQCSRAVGRCRGTVTLFAYLPVKRRHSAHKSVFAARATRRRKIVLGRAHFNVRGGRRSVIKVHISRKGRRQILRKRLKRCRVTISSSGRSVTRKVTVRVRPTKKRGQRR